MLFNGYKIWSNLVCTLYDLYPDVSMVIKWISYGQLRCLAFICIMALESLCQ
jgi:hypothetical protein